MKNLPELFKKTFIIIPKTIKWIFLISLAIFQLFPLIQLLSNSLRTDVEIKTNPIGFPGKLMFSNFSETWKLGGYAIAFLNSFVIGISVIVIVISFASLAAYALSKLSFKGKNFFIAYFLIALSLPGFLYIVPNYFIFNFLGLIDTKMGVILIYAAVNIPFNLLLLRTFLLGIPKELEEAAKIDGCSEFTSFLRITMPIAKPIFMTVALLVFLNTWNEFLWANTFLHTDSARTVSTRFVKFTSQWASDFAKIFTSGIISISPIIIMYIFLQKAFIQGITAGGVKG